MKTCIQAVMVGGPIAQLGGAEPTGCTDPRGFGPEGRFCRDHGAAAFGDLLRGVGVFVIENDGDVSPYVPGAVSETKPCPVCGHRRTEPSRWCGGDRCLNAVRLYMAGKIQSAAPPYDVPETRLRAAEATR